MMTTLLPVFRTSLSFTFLHGERSHDVCMSPGHSHFFLLIPEEDTAERPFSGVL